MAGLIAASQVGPGEAVSNLAKWAELVGIQPLPAILRTREIDQWVAIGAALVLISIALSWVVEYRILRGYVKQHGGSAAFVEISNKQNAAIRISLLASALIMALLGLVGYYTISQPYRLGEKNAYLRVMATVPIYPTADKREFAIHFFQTNVGKEDALSALHTSNTFHASASELSEEDIDRDFQHVIDGVKNDLKTKRGGKHEVGSETYFTYLFTDGDELMKKIEGGETRFYVYWVHLYRDALIPPDTFIATELCVVVLPTHALQVCPTHNGRVLVR